MPLRNSRIPFIFVSPQQKKTLNVLERYFAIFKGSLSLTKALQFLTSSLSFSGALNVMNIPWFESQTRTASSIDCLSIFLRRITSLSLAIFSSGEDGIKLNRASNISLFDISMDASFNLEQPIPLRIGNRWSNERSTLLIFSSFLSIEQLSRKYSQALYELFLYQMCLFLQAISSLGPKYSLYNFLLLVESHSEDSSIIYSIFLLIASNILLSLSISASLTILYFIYNFPIFIFNQPQDFYRIIFFCCFNKFFKFFDFFRKCLYQKFIPCIQIDKNSSIIRIFRTSMIFYKIIHLYISYLVQYFFCFLDTSFHYFFVQPRMIYCILNHILIFFFRLFQLRYK